MRATILHRTLKPSPEESNTVAVAELVAEALRACAVAAANLVGVARALRQEALVPPESG